MGRMASLSLIVVMVIIGWALPALADTIKLKSGEEINATIVERTDQQIKVTVKGVQVSYYPDEIESINGEALGAIVPQGKENQGLPNKGEGLLGDKEDTVILGTSMVHLTPPAGWDKQSNIESGKVRQDLYYEKEPGNHEVTITVKKTNAGSKSTRAITSMRFSIRALEEKSLDNFTVQKPQEVTLNGLTAAYVEMTRKNTNGNIASTAWYKFLIDGKILTLQLSDLAGSFQENLELFKKMAASIRVEPVK